MGVSVMPEWRYKLVDVFTIERLADNLLTERCCTI